MIMAQNTEAMPGRKESLVVHACLSEHESLTSQPLLQTIQYSMIEESAAQAKTMLSTINPSV